MLNYCIERLKLYSFQKIDSYEEMGNVYEDEYLFLKNGVIELLTKQSSKDQLKRIQYFKQIQQLMDDLNEYEGKDNRDNLQYLGFMLSLIDYEAKYRELKHCLGLIDINNYIEPVIHE